MENQSCKLCNTYTLRQHPVRENAISLVPSFVRIPNPQLQMCTNGITIVGMTYFVNLPNRMALL